MGDVVPRGFLSVLSLTGQGSPTAAGADGLSLPTTSPSIRLPSRVIVNRVWKWHFGTGIVNTPDNFGIMGDKPSNPELLEYLASEFVSHGHSIKWLQRQIMLSAVYQTSVEESPEAHEKDARQPALFALQSPAARRRRNCATACSSPPGDLDLKDTAGPSTDFTPDNLRRTVFCKVSRYRLNNYLHGLRFSQSELYRRAALFKQCAAAAALLHEQSVRVQTGGHSRRTGSRRSRPTRRGSPKLTNICSSASQRRTSCNWASSF